MTRQSSGGISWSAFIPQIPWFQLTGNGIKARGCVQTLQVHPEGGRDFRRWAFRFPRIHLLGCYQYRRTFPENNKHAMLAHSKPYSCGGNGEGQRKDNRLPSDPQNLCLRPSRLPAAIRISCTIRLPFYTLHQLRCSATREQEPSASCDPLPCPNAPVHHL